MNGSSGVVGPAGTQPERTRLAWRRTVLTVTVVTLLAVRLALLSPQPWVRALASALAMLLWLAVLTVSWRRIAAMRQRAPLSATGPTVLVIAAAVAGLAAVGLGLLAA